MAFYAVSVNMISTTLQKLATQSLPLLILDFDGTICLGDGPVLAYAQGAAEQLPTEQQHSFLEEVALFLDDGSQQSQYKDGYAAVAALAKDHLTEQQLDDAYAQSRLQLAAGKVQIHTAPGLAALLESLSGKVHRVVFTNAPNVGLVESLEILGLSAGIDAVITDAAKPRGFRDLIAGVVLNKPAAEILSVGDVWVNDIEPAASAGCATAFIDRFSHRNGPASVSATNIEALFPAIQDWANNPLSFQSTHPLPSSTPEEKA